MDLITGIDAQTVAIPLQQIVRPGHPRALCPTCGTGRLQPYRIQIDLGGTDGQAAGYAWVAVCAGSDPTTGESPNKTPTRPCGFNTPLQTTPPGTTRHQTPNRHPNPRRATQVQR